tara:strand:+ start:13955 stop:14467 length:513 start_codon:yes stop_codon:yes gene_type:complete
MLYLDESPYSPYDLHRMEMYDLIYDYESRFRDLDDPDNYYRDRHYYIGLSFYDKEYQSLLLAATIKNNTFFQFKFEDNIDYLNNFSILQQNFVFQPQILYLMIDNDSMYNVVIKTFWIKIIQRNWKRILKERTHILQKSHGLLNYLHNREIGIRQISLPGLHGMLSHLKA